jgi:hypothetical protein
MIGREALLLTAVTAFICTVGYVLDKRYLHAMKRIIAKEAIEHSLHERSPLAIEGYSDPETPTPSEQMEDVLAEAAGTLRGSGIPEELSSIEVAEILSEYERELKKGPEILTSVQRMTNVLDLVAHLPVQEGRVEVEIRNEEIEVDLKKLIEDLNLKLDDAEGFIRRIRMGKRKIYFAKISDSKNDEAMLLSAMSDYLASLVVKESPIPIDIYFKFDELMGPYISYRVSIEDEDKTTIKVLGGQGVFKTGGVFCDDYAVMVFLLFLRKIGVLKPK